MFKTIALLGASSLGLFSTQVCVAAPILTGAHLDASNLDAATGAAAPRLALQIAGAQGAVRAEAMFVSPGGQTHTLSASGAGSTLALTGAPLNRYAQPGLWRLRGLWLTDAAGTAAYTGAALSRAVPQTVMAVANSSRVDTIAPTIVSGRIVTPVVGGGGSATVALHVSDAVSGADTISVHMRNFQSVDYVFTGAASPAVRSGTITATGSLAGWPSGWFRVTAVRVCDAAKNCVAKVGPAAMKALFGSPMITLQ